MLTLAGVAVMLLVLASTAPAVPAAPTSGEQPLGPASEVLEARVIAVSTPGAARPSDGTTLGPPPGATAPGTLLVLQVTSGSQRGREVRITLGGETALSLPRAGRRYSPGDRVVLSYTAALDGQPASSDQGEPFEILDQVRWPWLVWAGLALGAAVTAVAGGQGLRALLGLAAAAGTLWWFVIPRLIAGQPPVPVALIGCALIAVPSLVLTHGWGREGLVPLASITGTLALVGVLTAGAVQVAHLTGLASSEEISLVYVGTGGAVDPQGLLLAGMLVGVVGALVDVAVAQSAAVFEFHRADPAASRRALFVRGMSVGRAHVAASVHSLVLAYAGAALPLLLLLAMYAGQLDSLWNREMVAAEVVRSVVGCVGLAMAMPLTTWLSCLACRPGLVSD